MLQRKKEWPEDMSYFNNFAREIDEVVVRTNPNWLINRVVKNLTWKQLQLNACPGTLPVGQVNA